VSVYVKPGPTPNELFLHGLRNYEGEATAYLMTYDQARELARALLTQTGAFEREVAPADLVDR
jgi:hypothetical protein